MDVFYDQNRTLYVADYNNDRIQKYAYGNSSGTTVPGLTLSNPTAVYATNNGLLYIVDYLNYRVVQWNNGIMTTVAAGRGSGATFDKMSTSYALYIDANLNIYISEYGNHRVSFWTAGNTTIGRLVCSQQVLAKQITAM